MSVRIDAVLTQDSLLSGVPTHLQGTSFQEKQSDTT